MIYQVQDETDPGLDNMGISVEENTREQLQHIQPKKKKKNHKNYSRIIFFSALHIF